MFIFDRERQSVSRGEAEREGDPESEAGSRLWAVSTEPNAGLELTSLEIMTWAAVGCLTDWATQAPQDWFLTGPRSTPVTDGVVNQHVLLEKSEGLYWEP